jgi:Flp pilus assembly protein TadD
MNDFDNRLREAFRLHQAGDVVAAESGYGNLLVEAPDHAQLLYLYGTLKAQRSQFHAALELLRKATDLQPGIPDAHINLGNVYYELGNRADAAIAYRNALDRRPGAIGAVFGLGKIHLDNEAYQEASHAFERVVQNVPKFFDGLMLLGDAYVRLNRENDALIQYERALAIQPCNREAIMRLGYAATVTGAKEKTGLLSQLENDYLYSDPGEAWLQAKALAGLYDCPQDAIKDHLAGLFDDFNPSELYSDAWWREALSPFSTGGNPFDIYARSVFSSIFAWSIPSASALMALSDFSGGRRLNSPGAGTGYWEYLLAQYYDKQVYATDKKLRHRFIDVQRADYSEAEIMPDDVVFLSWIPRGASAAESIAQKIQPGQRLILAGEHQQDGQGVRICATERFYKLIDARFRLMEKIQLVRFSGFNDSVCFYERI